MKGDFSDFFCLFSNPPSEFPPDVHPADKKEDDDPGGGHKDAVEDALALEDAPASEHDVPHALDGLSVGQQPCEGDHPVLGDPLQRPDDPREQHVGQGRPHRQLHRVSAVVHNRREEEPETHPA